MFFSKNTWEAAHNERGVFRSQQAQCLIAQGTPRRSGVPAPRTCPSRLAWASAASEPCSPGASCALMPGEIVVRAEPTGRPAPSRGPPPVAPKGLLELQRRLGPCLLVSASHQEEAVRGGPGSPGLRSGPSSVGLCKPLCTLPEGASPAFGSEALGSRIVCFSFYKCL